jgi:N-acetylmuramoyl-L-alanine amidase
MHCARRLSLAGSPRSNRTGRSANRVGTGPWRAVLAALFFATPLGLGACRSPAPAPPPEPAASPTVGWVAAPLSWEKLDDVELWLAGPDARTQPDLRIEAWLALGEGLVHFARVEAPQVAPDILALRRAKAQRVLKQAAGDPFASSSQRRRAESLLTGLGSVPTAPLAAVSLPRVHSRSEWGAARAVPARLTPNSGTWGKVTVHHSGPPDGRLAPSPDVARTVIRRIQKHHMETNGWGDIGYHFLIDPAGEVYAGRSLEWQGAHAGHDAQSRNNNPHNLGICLLGDFQSGAPTPTALAALARLVDELRSANAIPRAAVFAHRQLASSVCPGPVLDAWTRTYRGGRDSMAALPTPASAPLPRPHGRAASHWTKGAVH